MPKRRNFPLSAPRFLKRQGRHASLHKRTAPLSRDNPAPAYLKSKSLDVYRPRLISLRRQRHKFFWATQPISRGAGFSLSPASVARRLALAEDGCTERGGCLDFTSEQGAGIDV